MFLGVPDIPTSMFIKGAEHNGKGLKALAFTIFWDTPQHFLKTHFSLESGFLVFLVLQISLLVMFIRGAEHNGKGLKALAFTFSEIPHIYFLKTHFSLENALLVFLEFQQSLLVSFQGYWTQWQRFESSSIHCFWDTPLLFLKTCFRFKSGLLSFLELQISLLVCFQGYWTQWKRFESSSIHHFWDTPQHFLRTHFP